MYIFFDRINVLFTPDNAVKSFDTLLLKELCNG
jgi:hypothetical protein